MSDIDIVSDLNNSNDVVPADQGSVQVGREPTPQPTKVDTQTSAPAEKPLSLRDQISSAVKGENVTPPAASTDGAPARNADGTFAPKPKDGATAAAEATVQAVPAGSGSSPVAAPAGIDPTVFNALPAETQVTLARTMEELNERQSRLVSHESIEQLIAPRRQAWALNGMTEAQAVNQLFALSDFASTDPSGFIKYFAQQSNVNLEDIVFGDDPGDPETNELKAKIAQLESQITGFTTQQQQTQQQETVNRIVNFFEQKDEAGTLLRPYAAELGQQIYPFIQAAKSANPNASMEQVLQDAYDRACWGTPSIRAKLQEAATTAAQANTIREQQHKVARAQNAGVSVAPGVPTTPAPTPADGSMNLRDTIRASMAMVSNS